jgi:NAD-dependent deacetylase
MSIKAYDYQKIVVLTGAGISAESGISTFRDAGGLWEKHRVEDVATPEAFDKDPKLVWRFYSHRRLQAAKAKPNPAHQTLVDFSRKGGNLILVTQNVDVLHQRADGEGSVPTFCMHGSLHQTRCEKCENVFFDDHAYFDEAGNFSPASSHLCSDVQKNSPDYLHRQLITYRDSLPLSPCCGIRLRPHIVWFGEIPLHMDEIQKHLSECDLFISVGTSGQVYPAAGFLQVAKMGGARTVCLNIDPLPQSRWVDEFIQGKAGEKLPEFMAKLSSSRA